MYARLWLGLETSKDIEASFQGSFVLDHFLNLLNVHYTRENISILATARVP